MLIDGCTLATGDDSIAIKSGMNAYGRAFHRPSQNITVRNCLLQYGLGIAIGSESASLFMGLLCNSYTNGRVRYSFSGLAGEMSGDVRHVVIENSRAEMVSNVFRVKSGRGRGGIVEDITVRNVTFDAAAQAIRLDMYYATDPPGNATTTPIVRDIRVQSLKGVAGRAGDLECLPESPCTKLQFQNVEIRSVLGFQCKHCQGTCEHVSPKCCF